MCGNVTKYESGHMWAHPRQCCSDVVSIYPCASIRTCLASKYISWSIFIFCLKNIYFYKISQRFLVISFVILFFF